MRILVIKRFLTFLAEMKDLHLENTARRGAHAPLAWPPVFPADYPPEPDDPLDWRAWARKLDPSLGGYGWFRGQWRSAATSDGYEWVADEWGGRLEPGSTMHFRCAVAVGRHLFDIYRIPTQRFSSAAVLQHMAEIYDTVRSQVRLRPRPGPAPLPPRAPPSPLALSCRVRPDRGPPGSTSACLKPWLRILKTPWPFTIS